MGCSSEEESAMTTPQEELRRTVSELEDELAAIESLDTDTREMLQQAAADIQSVLGEDQPAATEPTSLAERLKQSLQEFEADHPALAGALERTIHALGQIGI